VLLAGCGPSAPSTPLHVAAGGGNYPAVRRHIAADTDLNAKDKSGWTALHLAAMAGDLPMGVAGAGREKITVRDQPAAAASAKW